MEWRLLPFGAMKAIDFCRWMAATAVAAAAVGCDRDENQGTAEVEDVKEEPARFYGETVTLSGEVDQVLGPRAFEMEGDDLFFDEQIVVLTRSPVRLGGEAVADDDELAVTGTVRPFTTTEIERELGWDLEPEYEVEFDQRPVIIAEEIRRLEESARWSQTEQPEGALVGLYALYTADDPAALAGTQIVLDGARVMPPTEGEGMWIGYGPTKLMYVVPTAGVTVPSTAEGARLDIVGVLRQTPDTETLTSTWKLSGQAADQVAATELYLEAMAIAEAQPETGTEDGERRSEAPSGQEQGGAAEPAATSG